MSNETARSERPTPRLRSVVAGAPRPSGRAVDELRRAVTGRVLLPVDEDYDRVHRIWNRARQDRPAVIVECAADADVVAALAFAGDRHLPVAVRGSGYAPSGASTGPGLVIDLRPLARVHVDRADRCVTVGAGATWGDVSAATAGSGLVAAGLSIAQIGVIGSTLSGGHGHLRRAFGLTCDNLDSARIVRADGSIVAASGDERSELLWGLRGGGGNFGVVTSMRMRLHRLPSPVLAGTVVFPAARVADLLRCYRDCTAGLPDEISTRFSVLASPAVGLPRALAVTIPPHPVVAISVVTCGDAHEARRWLEPLRSAGPALADDVASRSLAELAAAGGEPYPAGTLAEASSAYLPGLDAATIGSIEHLTDVLPCGLAELHLDQMGGAVARVSQMSSAAPHRDAAYLMGALVRWSDPERGPALQSWLAATTGGVGALAAGGTHIGMDCGNVCSEQAYGDDSYLRLGALKRAHDPGNRFARKLNVEPLA